MILKIIRIIANIILLGINVFFALLWWSKAGFSGLQLTQNELNWVLKYVPLIDILLIPINFIRRD